MQVESAISPETVQAYRETDFRVDTDPPVVLNVQVRNPALQQLYNAHRSESCVFITACNPHGALLTDEENEQLQQALARELAARSLQFLPGLGKHPIGDWPGEESFLVFGLSREAAKTLGRKFQQNAVVWCGPDAVPELLLLR